MRIHRGKKLLGAALLACALPAGLAAQTTESANIDQKVAGLEARIAQLESELKAQKHPAMVNAAMPQETITPEGTPASPPANPPEARAEAPAPPPDPFAAIKSVLSGVAFTGFVDGYYGYNANHGVLSTGQAGTITEPFSFRRDAFGLNLVELQLDKPVDKSSPFGFRVALGFGDAINAVNECSFCFASSSGDGDQTGTQYLKEAYGSYMAPIGKGLQIDFGKWVTPTGAEVIETSQNWNYSRSLLFYYTIPFYHFGARVKYTVNDKFSITGYATNGWNNITPDDSNDKTGGVTVTISPTKKFSISETWMGGPRRQVGAFFLPGFGPADTGHWNNLSDTVLTFNPTSKLSLMANVDYDRQDLPGGGSVDYTGAAGYARYQFTPKVAFAARGEYLNDHTGFATGLPQHVWETTGTIERTLANHVIARLEYRHDESNHDFFPYGGGGGFISKQDTAKLGVVFLLQPAQ
jgi:putative OmpL-like beta-barrel porin-2